jgi:hypothetical protein
MKGADMLSRIQTRNFLILALLSVAAISLGACESADDTTSPLAGDTQLQAAGIWLPTTEAMVASTDANDTQEQGLRQARGRWGSADLDAESHPMHGFLLEASTFLDQEQMAKLVTLLAEQREERRQSGEMCDGQRGQRRGQRGQRPGQHEGILGYADELELTEDQVAALTALREETRGEFRGQRGRRGRGHGPTQEQRAQMEELRDAHQAKVQEILTDAQSAKLEELREQKREERRGVRQERGMERQERRIEFLAEILDLSDGQREALESLMAGQHDQLQALGEEFREGLEGGRPTGEQRAAHFEAMEAIRSETRAGVLELLDEDQAKLFEALEEMRPEPHSRRGRR